MQDSTSMFIRRLFHSSRNIRLDIKQQLNNIELLNVPNLPFKHVTSLASQTYRSLVDVDEGKSPLIMLHGLFGAKQNYSMVGKHISEKTKRKVIGVDLRNHGASPNVMPHDYLHMASDTEQFLKSLGCPVVLAGHLMGAKVAMLVALKNPSLVQLLIVIDNSPVGQTLDSQFDRDLQAMCHVTMDSELSKFKSKHLHVEVDKVMQDYEANPMVRLFLMSNLKPRSKSSDTSPLEFRVPVMNFLKDNVISEMGKWPSAEVQGFTYEKPVLVLRALKSPFVPNLDIFSKHFNNIQAVDFDCGHWLVSEKPHRFVDEVVQFLESND